MRQTLAAGPANVSCDAGRTWTKIQTRPGAVKVGEHSALWSEIIDRNPEYLAAAKEILEDDADVAADGSTPGIVEHAAARCNARGPVSHLGTDSCRAPTFITRGEFINSLLTCTSSQLQVSLRRQHPPFLPKNSRQRPR